MWSNHGQTIRKSPGIWRQVRMKYCEKCGSPIEDLSHHPKAKLCKTCRGNARKRIVEKAVAPAIPTVKEYLKIHDWPAIVRPRNIVDEHPELYTMFEIEEGNGRIYWIVSNALGCITTPSGERYISPTNKKRVYERTKITEINDADL